jgi:hypothetical protein
LIRGVSAERAARWARILGYLEALFVKLAMQAELDAAGIKLKIDVKAAYRGFGSGPAPRHRADHNRKLDREKG